MGLLPRPREAAGAFRGNEGAGLALPGCWAVEQEARGTRRGGTAVGTCAQRVDHPRAGGCAQRSTRLPRQCRCPHDVFPS